MKLKTHIAFLIIMLATTNIKSQNLVPNPYFTVYDTCPDNFSQIKRATYWSSPNTGTPDYYNQCCTLGPLYVGVPYNNGGFQEAINNDGAYAALIAIEPSSTNYREYIQAKLTNPLTINQKYFITIYVSLADNYKYATDALGIYLSKTAVSKIDYTNLGVIPQVANPIGHFLTDTLNWMKISGSFTADSAYQYITIGNFKDDTHTDTMSVPSTASITDSYYYVDDICISTDSLLCNATIGIKTYSGLNNMNVYCNNSTLYIKGINEIVNIEIYDAEGRLVLNQKISRGDDKIELDNFSNGIYLVKTDAYNEQQINKICIIKNP